MNENFLQSEYRGRNKILKGLKAKLQNPIMYLNEFQDERKKTESMIEIIEATNELSLALRECPYKNLTDGQKIYVKMNLNWLYRQLINKLREIRHHQKSQIIKRNKNSN